MREAEWILRNSSRRRERPSIRWRGEIKKFGGKEWTQTAQDWSRWRSMGEAFVLLAAVDDDDGECEQWFGQKASVGRAL